MVETPSTVEMWDALSEAGWTRRGDGSWHWKDPETGVGEGHRLETPAAHQLMVERQEEQAKRESEQKARSRRKTAVTD